MHKIAKGVAFAVALALCGPAFATDPDEKMPGKVAIVKPAILGKFVSKPVGAFTLPSFLVTQGAMQLFDTNLGGAGANTYPLTAGQWKGLGTPAGSKGWKYLGTRIPSDPCNVVLIKTTVIKGICKGTGMTLTPPFSGNLGVNLVPATLAGGGNSKRYCALFGGTPVKNQASIFKRINAPAPVACPTIPVPTTTSTSSSTTSSSSTSSSTTSSTSSTTIPSCCGAERISLVSSAGTLRVDNLAPFPFPAGVQTTMDSQASDTGFPTCHHPVLVPSGGFNVPNFDIPSLNYCSQIITLGCQSGGKAGKGNLWDGNGTAASTSDVTKQGDTSDGTCDTSFTGANCTTVAGGAGANTLGKVVTTHPGGSTGGIRSAIDVPVTSRTWSDSVCSPATNPGCCVTSSYGDDTVGNGELLVTLFDFIISPTTDSASGAFVDLNSDGCKRAGSGFNTPSPDGPKVLHGTKAAGPCCTVGQATNVVSVGVGFSGGAPLFDLGFQSTIPNTTAACGAASGGNCVLTTNGCLGSPSGAFLDRLE